MVGDVSTPTSIVAAAETARLLPRTLKGGTTAMRLNVKYLPQEIAESQKAYETRLARSFLFNGFGKTVDNMAGKVFAKSIALGDDMPPEAVALCENIDLAGRNLDVFALDVFDDGLTEGISYILVDMGAAPDGNLTVAEAKALNRRPWFVHIKAAQVLGWRSADYDGAETLTQFRFRDDQCEEDGLFGEKTVPQIKVFNRTGNTVTWQAWRQDDKSAWVLYEEGPVSIPEIAICPVYINRTGYMVGLPPLAGLAEVNLAHWQSQSDQRNILHVARVPILFGAGWAQDSAPVEIGATRMLAQSDPAAKLTYVEHSGAAIGSGRDDLKDLEFQMQVLGLELLIPKQSGQSATGAALDSAKMNAPLAMMAKALEDALEQAFGFIGMYAGVARDTMGGSLEVNKDFGVGYGDFRDITVLAQAVTMGALSRETFLRELQRRGNLLESIDPNEEVLKALNEMSGPDPFANDTTPNPATGPNAG